MRQLAMAVLLPFIAFTSLACGSVKQPEDCAGVAGGTATLDNCGTCDDNPDNDCVQDCAGTWGGTAYEDDCGACDADSDNDCVQDCLDVWGGTAYEDHCGTCDDDPDNDCAQDCLDVWGGTAYEDHCGTCDDDPDNDCVQDCLDAWGGNAYFDTCGNCVNRAAAEPELIYTDATDRSMSASCSDYELPTPVLVEEASALVQANTSAISDAWVYFRNADNDDVGSLEMNPENYGSATGNAVFDTPIVVYSVHICSWWNNATLLQLDLYGNSNTCLNCPAAAGADGYLDTCGTCIDRDAAEPELLYSDDTDRTMTASCSDYDLPTPLLVEEASALVQAGTSATSDAWVYFLDAGEEVVGSLEMQPQNYGQGTGNAVFDTPIVVYSVHICSWWNYATLLQLDLYGDSTACTP